MRPPDPILLSRAACMAGPPERPEVLADDGGQTCRPDPQVAPWTSFEDVSVCHRCYIVTQ
jgi:hypothetical protein